MNVEERIRNFETRLFKMIFHSTVNDHDTLFGGIAMQWMDEIAYITATRFTRMKMVTISCENVEFLQAINYGSIVEIVGKVVKVGNVRIEIKVEIYTENLDNDNRVKAVDAIFTFAAIDEHHNPVRIDLNESLK